MGFENLGFVIMSTRENIRLIARSPLLKACIWIGKLKQFQNAIFFQSVIYIAGSNSKD